jgi:hypothetical protein
MSHSPRGDLHTDIRAAPGFARGRRSALFAPLFPGYSVDYD